VYSTLAGFAVPVILQPLNSIATKHYTQKQLAVMAARDNKAHVVTEALHGIRQIKFSATEKQWEKRILDAREQELKSQRSIYVWATFLTFTWIAMPALIGATAISVYAWQAQQIEASVAFTALSVFSSLEFTIGAVPMTITEMLDARVSTDRIHQHLKSEERLSVQKSGSSVELKNASIAWPSETNAILQGLILQFPTGALR
jgi:ABC-type multidrug transport system fused ATPase/permease subunit